LDKDAVVILDPRGTIVTGGIDVIDRHRQYGKWLLKESIDGPLRLVIFSTSIDRTLEDFSGNELDLIIISKPTFNPLFFAFKAKKAIHNLEYKPKLLITGDPWESFFSAYFFNKISSTKIPIPIQVQVHGDIGDEKWAQINWRNRIRSLVAVFSLIRATRIRATSKYQADNLVNRYKVTMEKIDVLPVPIFFKEESALTPATLHRPRTLGFVGRIHPDRGTASFVKLIKILKAESADFSVSIIGDGPEREVFLRNLNEILPKKDIAYHGHVSEEELKLLWENIGVLVSVAPVESYGRSMREAISKGIPVWATASSGVSALIDQAPKGAVRLINFGNPINLKSDFNDLMESPFANNFGQEIYRQDLGNMSSLAKIWVKMSIAR